MKNSRRLFALAAACLLAAVSMSSLAQDKGKGEKGKDDKGKVAVDPVAVVASPSKWEYKIATLDKDDEESEKELNKLGADGWELVGTPSVVTSPRQKEGAGGTTTKVKLIFKRPKR